MRNGVFSELETLEVREEKRLKNLGPLPEGVE